MKATQTFLIDVPSTVVRQFRVTGCATAGDAKRLLARHDKADIESGVISVVGDGRPVITSRKEWKVRKV